MNNIKILKDLEKYISFANKQCNFSNDADYKWHKELAGMIENLIKENQELKKENRFLKKHEYTNICQNCKKQFFSKRPNVLWCENCRTKMYNINYYANLSEEKKKERAEKSKIIMRSIRAKKKRNSLEGKEDI